MFKYKDLALSRVSVDESLDSPRNLIAIFFSTPLPPTALFSSCLALGASLSLPLHLPLHFDLSSACSCPSVSLIRRLPHHRLPVSLFFFFFFGGGALLLLLFLLFFLLNIVLPLLFFLRIFHTSETSFLVHVPSLYFVFFNCSLPAFLFNQQHNTNKTTKMSSSFYGLVAPIKRKHAENLTCFFCNHLQFDPNFESLHVRQSISTQRTKIEGEPDDYFITIPTRFLLRDGWGPRNDQELQDCLYCQFLHDALNLFFLEPSMNWIKDATGTWDGLLLIHIRRGFPLVLQCQKVIQFDKNWIHLRADIEVFCHDRSALSICDFPSMYLEAPELEEMLEDRECENFMNFNMRNCGDAADRLDDCYVTPNRLLHIDWYAQEIRLKHIPGGPQGKPGAPEIMEYATLSHCWSETDPDFPRLLRHNMPDWSTGFSFDDLPQAIRDAAQVAYTNKIDYLWIESICVIQDDAVDIMLQKPHVGAYFRDSVITIVAASSASPNDSFLYPRRKDWITKQIEFTAPSGGTATIDLRRRYSRQTSPLDATDESSYKSQLKSFRRTGPIYRQGRCYQEALLGTRVISFTSAAITVNCRRHNQCTGDFTSRYKRNNVFRGLVCNYEDPALYKKYLAKYSGIITFDEMLNICKGREDTALWLQAVMQYTARNMIVHPKDKLSGIAGLASLTSMAQKFQYFAGLWLANLHEGLLWEVRLRPGQTHATRIMFPFKNQKAPTFSWASVDAGVYYTEPWKGLLVPDATIIQACSMPKAHDPFGDVDGGFIKLKGRLVKCEVSQTLSGPTGTRGKLSVAHFDMEEKEDGVDTPKTKRVPFVADGSLIMVKNRKPMRGKGKACFNCACRMINKRKLESERISCHSATFLTRNHCEFRKNSLKHGQKRIVGTAYVLCLGWREPYNDDVNRHEHPNFEGLVLTASLRYPGAFERIGCIRNVPAAIYGRGGHKIITLV
ncbi:hypothetical protein GGI43DRAFT_184051 [Trichoderma evansii]